MTVHEIVRLKLVELKADGLAGDGCGCGIDDLFCCESYPGDCVPAKRQICDDPESEWYGEECYVPMDAGDTGGGE